VVDLPAENSVRFLFWVFSLARAAVPFNARTVSESALKLTKEMNSPRGARGLFKKTAEQ